jgi:2'-5' RNA ligase
VSPGGTQRLFVAVDPPTAVAEELTSWARAQRGGSQGMRIVEPRNVHLTLAFLGERTAGEIANVTRAMSEAAIGGGVNALRTGEPLLLPPRRPRVLAVTVTDSGGRLAELQDALVAELGRLVGFRAERAFRPHLTLARLRRDARPPHALEAPPQLQFDARELVLHRSHLEPAGARYEVVERVTLN